MTTLQLFEWMLIGILCLASAGAAVVFLSRRRIGAGDWAARWQTRLRSGAAQFEPSVWLFDGDVVVESSTPSGTTQSAAGPRDWAALRQAVSDRFPAFPAAFDQIATAEPLRVPAKDPKDPGEITVENFGGLLRVELSEQQTNSYRQAKRRWNDGPQDSNSLAIERTPYPIWRVNREGKVLWSNPAYDALEQVKETDASPARPSPPLFPIPSDFLKQNKTRRIPVAQDGTDSRHWFDVEIVPDDEGALCYAVNIDAVVDAENAQRNFVQTLAKTFAQLSIGLAIFDRNRQLALFNPALIDLTALPAEFLSVRPNLLTFFDRLRDNNMMPEPKDYKSWRHQMAELVAAASDGRYHETWTLPSGSVYSISGRPHPDGAIAFLFEDITAEITLTRRFRSDLELGQSVFDQLDDAIVVFAADGGLAICNRPYRDLW